MSPEAGVMGPVSCLIIQDDPPISGGQEAKYTGGSQPLNIESRHVPYSYSVLVTVHQFRDLSQGWALSLQARHAGLPFLKLSASTSI